MVSFIRKYSYTLAPGLLLIGFVQSHTGADHGSSNSGDVSSTDVSRNMPQDGTTVKANVEGSSDNSSAPTTTATVQNSTETNSKGESDSGEPAASEIGGPEWLAGTSDQILFLKFFEEMKNKNYATAKEICAELERRASGSGDASKVAAVNELRSTLDLISPAD